MSLTNQEIFDTVARHLITQGRRAMKQMSAGGGLKCAYRGEDGTKCAVGCLIPDELYDPNMEGRDVELLFLGFPKVEELLGAENVELLFGLQYVHDTCRTNENGTFEKQELVRRLREVALRENVSAGALNGDWPVD